MSEILKSILGNLDAYPQLKTDCAKLTDKERYLPQNCNTCITKE